MSRRRRILLLAALAVTILVAVLIVRWNSSLASLTLADGSRLTCQAVEVTTSASTSLRNDSFFIKFARRLPAFLQRFAPASVHHRLPFADGTNIVFWLELDRGEANKLTFTLRDPDGSNVVKLEPMTRRLANGSTLILLRESVWPRRAKDLVVQIFDFDFVRESPTHLAGELKVRNPQIKKYPEWKADSLPIALRLDETEIKLERFESRPQPIMLQRISGTNLIERVAFIQFRRINITNAGYSFRWSLERGRIVDAMGNQRLLPIITTAGTGDPYEETIQIYGAKIPWPGESTYRLETWWRSRDPVSGQSKLRQLTFTVQPERWKRSVPTGSVPPQSK